MTPGTGWIPDDTFLARLKRAYRLSIDSAGATRGMWSDIDRRREDLHVALLGSHDDQLRHLLADPLTTDLYYGVDGICRSIFGELQENRTFAHDVAAMLRPALLSLFETVTKQDAGDFARLDAALRQTIAFPNPFRGEFGLETPRGLATERAIAAIYQAYRLIELLDVAGKSVVEIGPGMGRTAYYAFRAGVTDYTTIDLPMGVVAQACFLAATLGPQAIWMSGDDHGLGAGRIKLLFAKPERTFDVALNVDSLPEMPIETAFGYVAWINKHARAFLSINHEQNGFTVAEIAALTLPARGRREAHPMRSGYFEEQFPIGRPRFQVAGLKQLKARRWLRSTAGV